MTGVRWVFFRRSDWPRPGTGQRIRERGSSLPFVALCVVLVIVMSVVLAALSGRVLARSQAQAAADAAALAGAADGQSAARELANKNRATLVSFASHGAIVEVVVELGGVRATATAERSLVLPSSSSGRP